MAMRLRDGAIENCGFGFGQVKVAYATWNWHKHHMCFHASISGAILPVWSKTGRDEVLLHCARIGFKP